MNDPITITLSAKSARALADLADNELDNEHDQPGWIDEKYEMGGHGEKGMAEALAVGQKIIYEALQATECDHAEAKFVGHIAAPGRGIAYECEACDTRLVKIGGTYHDAADGPFEMSPEDVI